MTLRANPFTNASRDPGSVLHEAIGGVNLPMIAVNNGPDRFLCAGPVLSHFEFKVIGAPRRISDEEWRGSLQTNFPDDALAGRIKGLTLPVWTKNAPAGIGPCHNSIKWASTLLDTLRQAYRSRRHEKANSCA